MAKDFMSLDCGFPNFADDEPIEDKVSKLYNYTFMLLESLRYLLRNLDTDNFNAAALAEFKKEYEDKVNYAIADLETEVNENFARAELFTEFKTATEGALQNQTDALSKFETEVSKDYAKIAGLAEYEAIKSIDGKVKENTAAIAGVKGTADENAAELIEIAEWKGTKYQTFAEGLEAAEAAAKDAAKGYTDGKVTELSESFTEIEQKADANGAFIKLMVGQAVKLVGSDLKGMDDNQVVTSASAADFVMEAANGESTIKLRADRIKLGDNASVDNDGNLMIKRLWSSGDTANYYAKLYSSYGDFGVYESDAPKNAAPVNESCLWGLYNTLSDGLIFYTKGKEYMFLNKSGNTVTVKPQGEWNFNNADVSGLVVRFS